MKKLSRQSGFTLIEVIIAVTIFSLFMGMAIGSYITFHRAQNEAAIERALLLEGEFLMSQLSRNIKESFIDFDSYSAVDTQIFDSALYLKSLSDKTGIHIIWDKESGDFTLQQFDGKGDPADGYQEAKSLLSEGTTLEDFSISIFPSSNPYDSENAGNASIQYQPHVQIDMELSRTGRLTENVSLHLSTAVTSRFYQ